MSNQKLLPRFMRDRSGATMIEYGLILGIIGLGVVAVGTDIGGYIVGFFTTISNSL